MRWMADPGAQKAFQTGPQKGSQHGSRHNSQRRILGTCRVRMLDRNPMVHAPMCTWGHMTRRWILDRTPRSHSLMETWGHVNQHHLMNRSPTIRVLMDTWGHMAQSCLLARIPLVHPLWGTWGHIICGCLPRWAPSACPHPPHLPIPTQKTSMRRSRQGKQILPADPARRRLPVRPEALHRRMKFQDRQQGCRNRIGLRPVFWASGGTSQEGGGGQAGSLPSCASLA